MLAVFVAGGVLGKAFWLAACLAGVALDGACLATTFLALTLRVAAFFAVDLVVAARLAGVFFVSAVPLAVDLRSAAEGLLRDFAAFLAPVAGLVEDFATVFAMKWFLSSQLLKALIIQKGYVLYLP